MAKNGHTEVGDGLLIIRSGLLVAGMELFGILDDLLALVRLLVETVIAVAEDGAIAIGIRSGAETGVDGGNEVLLTSESAATGYFLDRESLVIEHIDGLAYTPLHDELLEADAHEQLHRLVQETLIGVKVEGDLMCGMTVYSLDIIDDGIDSDLSGGSPCCVPQLLNCGDLFEENHTVCF